MNTIRELKQQEKYNNMLKRKNKEISILKDDKEHLGEFLKESNEEIERLHTIIKEVREKVNIIQFKIESTTKNYNNLYIDLKSTLQGQELLKILDKEKQDV